MALSFFVETYGCQMNVADSALVERLLEQAGYRRAGEPGQADIVLVNTCSVRGHAEERIIGRLNQLLALRTARPQLVLGMLGCVAQHQSEQIARQLPFLDIIAGPDSYRRLPELVARALEHQQGRLVDVHLDRSETYADLEGGVRFEGAGAYVTVQRGCDHFCAYCIVPLLRGRERAVPPETVLRQVRELVDRGYREVTLLGQTVNSYRCGETDFAGLLRQVAQQPGLRRIRFLSPHPLDFDQRLIEAIGSIETVMPHLHLPVQSGSTKVLEVMGRQHSRDEFLKLVERLRTARPGLALSTDILVGFPGEGEPELEETVSLLEQVRFQTAYLYRYSERAGTRAAHRMPDTIPEPEKLRRLDRVITVQERITRETLQGYVGQEVEVLVDGPARRGEAAVGGRSAHNVPVVVEHAPQAPVGTLLRARVERSTGHTLIAEFVRTCGGMQAGRY